MLIHPKHPFRKFILQAALATGLAAAFLGLLPSAGRAQSAAAAPPTQRVLLLFGENRDLPGNVLLEQSARSEILKNTNRIEFYTETMDASHFPTARHNQLFRDYLQNKYAGEKLDLVMMLLGRDYPAARELVQAALPAVPAIFVVINDLDVPEAAPARPATAIFQRFDVAGTLKFIFQLQPETRRVVVIGGTSAGDQAVLARIRAAASPINNAAFEYWTNRPLAGIYQAAGHLPANTVILLATVQQDSAANPTYTAQVARTLAPAANVPVYVLSDGLIGSGALGGNLVRFEDLGLRAGALAAQVLAGKSVSQIPPEYRTAGMPMADWRALQRWHIRPSRLPQHCEVRYRSHSLWEDHWQLVVLFGVGFLIQAVTIAALLVQRGQQRRAEAEILRQRAELAHVSRVSMMGQLASALTHELNQPLGAILRNAEAAEVFLQAPQPNLAEVRAILTDIRRDDKRAGNVIDRMRSLFKRQRVATGKLDLRDLVEDTAAMARPDAAARNVKLTVDIAPHLPAAQGDRVHVQQVLLNLILNGMDAMEKIPKARRSLAVKVQATRNHNLQVSVSDCGTGVEPDQAVHIFEPFFTTKSNGMGMGLAISKTIMEAHGGDLWMTSNATQGTTFTFLLPPAGQDKVKPGDLPEHL